MAGQSPQSEDVSDFDGEGTPFLQGNAEFGEQHPTPRYRCDSATRSADPGDILLSIRAPVGALNIADRRFGIGRGLCAVKPTKIKPRYCWWLLTALVPSLKAVAVGSTYEAVTAEDVGFLAVDVPSLESQGAIANFLDAETARIDALIAKKRHLISVVREWEQSALVAILGDWRMGRTRTLRQYGASVLTGPFGTQLAAADYVDGGVPLINPTHIQRGRLAPEPGVTVSQSDASRLRRHRLAAGDVVLGRKGDVGRSAIVPLESDGWLCGSDSIAIRTGPLLDAAFLAAYLRLALTRQFLSAGSTGAMVANVNEALLRSLPVTHLPIDAQREASAAANRVLARAEAIEASLASQVTLLLEHRQALITAAVTGELEIPGVAA
jgi:type I restriction enzyme S subunit